MATIRTPIGRPPIAQITPAAVELFRRALALEEEYYDVCGRLHELLGLAPWDITVFDAVGEPTKEDFDHGWHRVVALREALQAALKAERTPAP
jgi:hypothetical protein